MAPHDDARPRFALEQMQSNPANEEDVQVAFDKFGGGKDELTRDDFRKAFTEFGEAFEEERERTTDHARPPQPLLFDRLCAPPPVTRAYFDPDIEGIFADLDADGSGTIDRLEFLRYFDFDK